MLFGKKKLTDTWARITSCESREDCLKYYNKHIRRTDSGPKFEPIETVSKHEWHFIRNPGIRILKDKGRYHLERKY